MKIKLIFVTVTIISLCLLLPHGSLAYYTSESTAHNVVNTLGVDIELQEWEDEERTKPFPEEGVGGVMPGDNVTKVVEVKNIGTAPAWVRVGVQKSVVLAGGAEGNTALLEIDFNKTDWTKQGGYFYYNAALNPGETTPPLFRHVNFNPGLDNRYKNSVATVTVWVDATQTANNGTSALDEAVLWPPEPGEEASEEPGEQASEESSEQASEEPGEQASEEASA